MPQPWSLQASLNGPQQLCTDDKALAGESCQAPTAFAELYRRHVSHVYRYLLVRVGGVHEAQDLTEQIFRP